MPEDNDMNAAILAELKKMNESLSFIRAVVKRFDDQENRKAQALRDMAKNLPRL